MGAEPPGGPRDAVPHRSKPGLPLTSQKQTRQHESVAKSVQAEVRTGSWLTAEPVRLYDKRTRTLGRSSTQAT